MDANMTTPGRKGVQNVCLSQEATKLFLVVMFGYLVDCVPSYSDLKYHVCLMMSATGLSGPNASIYIDSRDILLTAT